MKDYKEKYEQLTKFIKDLYPFMSDYCKEKTEGMIPELKENEDERVKNEIIAFVERSIRWGGGTPIPREQENKWIAWLEKQGELKPIFRVGDYIRNKKTKDRVLIEQIDIANKVYCYVSRDDAAEIHSDFRFSEQNDWEIIGQKIVGKKPTEWSEEDEKNRILIRDIIWESVGKEIETTRCGDYTVTQGEATSLIQWLNKCLGKGLQAIQTS